MTIVDRIIPVKLSSILVLTTILIVSSNGSGLSAYAVNGHGSSYGPSFGGASGIVSTTTGTQVLFKDGLTINKNVFDISQPSTTIKTQTLYAALPNTITLKIYDNAGSYYIKGGAIFFNVHGTEPKISISDTWVQFDKFGGIKLTDPHKILGVVKDKISYNGKYMYVTFYFTPELPMSNSDLIITALDNNLSRTTALVINAVEII